MSRDGNKDLNRDSLRCRLRCVVDRGRRVGCCCILWYCHWNFRGEEVVERGNVGDRRVERRRGFFASR